MKHDNENTLSALRELPAEVSLEQVSTMVAAFPIAVGLTAWLAAFKIHLNSILMTTSASLIIGGSAYVLSTTTVAEKPVAMLEPKAIEIAMTEPRADEPAVVFEAPKPKPAPPSETKPTALACMVVTSDSLMSTAPRDTVVPIPEPSAPQAKNEPTAVEPYHAVGNERRFELTDFTGVTVVGSMDVTLEIGDFNVVAVGDENMLELLDVRNENGMLKVGVLQSRGNMRNRGSVHLMVRMPRVDDLVIAGSGNIHADQLAPTKEMDLRVLGSGNLMLARVDEVGALNMTVEGSGGIDMATLASSDVIKVNVVGSGGVQVSKASGVDGLAISVEGSGNVDLGMVDVSGTTRIDLMGSGNVQVGGRTDRIEIMLQGSGDVNATSLRAKNGGKVHLAGSGNAYVHSDGQLEMVRKGTGTIHTSGSAGVH